MSSVVHCESLLDVADRILVSVDSSSRLSRSSVSSLLSVPRLCKITDGNALDHSCSPCRRGGRRSWSPVSPVKMRRPSSRRKLPSMSSKHSFPFDLSSSKRPASVGALKQPPTAPSLAQKHVHWADLTLCLEEVERVEEGETNPDQKKVLCRAHESLNRDVELARSMTGYQCRRPKSACLPCKSPQENWDYSGTDDLVESLKLFSEKLADL